MERSPLKRWAKFGRPSGAGFLGFSGTQARTRFSGFGQKQVLRFAQDDNSQVLRFAQDDNSQVLRFAQDDNSMEDDNSMSVGNCKYIDSGRMAPLCRLAILFG